MSYLNPEQALAAGSLSGAVLVLAGAGTGKTTVVVHRIANLIAAGVEPQAILAVTFTNKAAREMKERVKKLLGDCADQMSISTFHSFCAGVLRRHIYLLDYRRDFGIADSSYQNGLIREILSTEGLAAPKMDAGLILHQISLAKAALLGPDQCRERRGANDPLCLAQVYARYQSRMRQMDMLDFDDLLLLTNQLWERHPDILALYREKYSHLLIDEYQDTNAAQLQIMLKLAGTNGNVAVVGDDDQSIYGWRGADISNILQFEAFFTDAKIIRLEQNYRSTNIILNSANALIAKNRSRRHKRLWSAQAAGEKLLAVLCKDERDEADFLAKFILSEQPDTPLHHFALLLRSNHQARVIEEQFTRAKLPYTLIGTNSFYQRKEILDAISFLQLLHNPRDDFSFLRIVNVPPRGLGETSIEKLREYRRVSGMRFNELIRQEKVLQSLPEAGGKSLNELREILDAYQKKFAQPGLLYNKAYGFFKDVDYIDGLGRMYKPKEDALHRKDNLLEFLNSLAEYDEEQRQQGRLAEFLERFALQDDHDRRKDSQAQKQDAVTIMTVHAAKGLEFPVVMLPGCERHIFPHFRSVEDGTEEEERRLFYVALTRAKQRFIMSYAEKRRHQGKLSLVRPSPFLDELPQENIIYCTPEKAIRPASREEVQQSLLDMIEEFSSEQ